MFVLNTIDFNLDNHYENLAVYYEQKSKQVKELFLLWLRIYIKACKHGMEY